MTLARVHPGGGQAARGQGRGHQPAAEELAGGGDHVEQRRIGGAPLTDRLQRRPKLVEMAVDGGQQRAVRVGAETRRFVDVPAPEGGDAVLDLAVRDSPVRAASASASSRSVTPPRAETTTTGERPRLRSPSTMETTRSIAVASTTDDPPNFMTTARMTRLRRPI